MLKFKFGKSIIASVIIGTTVFGYSTHHDQAQAVGNYYYDGMHAGEYSGYSKAKNISKNNISIQYYPNASQSNLKSIGRVSNLNGWKVGLKEYKGQDSMGTGTVIGAHTFITNAHVIDDNKHRAAAPKYITFQLNRNGKSMPYAFHASEVIKVPQYDIAIVHTKENMSKYAKPVRIATNSEINKLKFNTPLYSLGYPVINNDNTKPYFNKLRVTQFSPNGTEIQTKDIFRAGASGSPMLNSQFNTMYGLRTYGYNLRGNAYDAYAKQEMSGGESFKGYAGNFVRQHIK
ncbi:trypsin-like peptidase domain-containing protein [Staphylococcus taiwanensis]|nr:trypsin-like peptidase domain-containing protein [Staphylococcus taiwanensis]